MLQTRKGNSPLSAPRGNAARESRKRSEKRFPRRLPPIWLACVSLVMIGGRVLLGEGTAAQRYVIDLRAAGRQVSPLLFGSNLEHTRFAVWKGIGAELLTNRKFAGENVADGRNDARIARAKPGPDGAVWGWQPVGLPHASFAADADAAYCGRQSQRIEISGTAGRGGLRQRGIPLSEGREYVARFQLKVGAALAVRARLTDGLQTEYARAETTVEPGEWREWEFRFTVPRTNHDGVLEVSFPGPGTLWLGAASLLPADHVRGMRRDVIDRLKEMGVPLLRWPGGNFTRDYRWKDGLLPADRRPPIAATWSETLPFSENYDFHDIGIDEFIALCRALDAEPSITLALGEGGEQEAADWVEYCNGPASSRWGKIRADRGHPEPFRVKYWSVGNEVYGKWMYRKPFTADSYAETVRRYAAAIRAVDPQAIVIVAGLDPAWDKTLVQKAGDSFHWLARHEYPPETAAFSGERGAAEYSRQARRPQEFIRPWLAEARRELDGLGAAGKRIGLSFDEWNVWHKWFTNPVSFDWHVSPTEGALLAAQFNMFCREAAGLNLAMAALFQPVNEGAIAVTPFSADLTAMGQVFALYRAHHGGRLLPMPAPNPSDQLDTCATLSADRRTVHVTVVNRGATPQAVALRLDGGVAASARAITLSVAELKADIPFERGRQDLVIAADGEMIGRIPGFGIARIDVDLRQ
jgi:alpha-L-arabinofuranosidase